MKTGVAQYHDLWHCIHELRMLERARRSVLASGVAAQLA
jgi:hypothetical protein